MATTKDRFDARQPRLPTSGGTLDAVSNVDAAWLAQVIETREFAFRLHRLRPQKDLTSVVSQDICCTELTVDISKLMRDYLAASEKLFVVTAALAKSRVDNSNGVASPDEVPNERAAE